MSRNTFIESTRPRSNSAVSAPIRRRGASSRRTNARSASSDALGIPAPSRADAVLDDLAEVRARVWHPRIVVGQDLTEAAPVESLRKAELSAELPDRVEGAQEHDISGHARRPQRLGESPLVTDDRPGPGAAPPGRVRGGERIPTRVDQLGER